MKILIIGNGVAGVTVAETIRSADKNASITIFTDEPYAFYSRPRLIEYLANKSTADQIMIHAESWYEKNGIALKRSARIKRIDPSARQIFDDQGTAYSYDKLILAAGASCSVPPIPGSGSEGVLTMRTLADAEKIKAAAKTAKRAAIIGGGLLGIEAASSLQSLGLQVRVIEVLDRLLPRQLDPEGSAILVKLLEAKGLSFCIGRKTLIIGKKENSLCVSLDDKSSEPADLVLISAGIRPNLSIVDGLDIGRTRGITVDAFMRTSISNVYACGDIAEWNGTIFGLWQPSREQGAVCGNHILGKETPYAGTMLSARSKAAGIEIASMGQIEEKEGTVAKVEKDEASGIYKKLFIRGQILVGAILVGNVKEANKLQLMIKNREQV